MTVESWGRGAPDYYKSVLPAKSVTDPNVQIRFNYSLETELPAQTDTGILTAYTVPASRQLNITFWKASANKSGLIFGYFYNTGTFYGRATIDVFGTGYTGETGAYVFNAGEIFQYRIVNPLDEAVSIAFRIAGTLTNVPGP